MVVDLKLITILLAFYIATNHAITMPRLNLSDKFLARLPKIKNSILQKVDNSKGWRISNLIDFIGGKKASMIKPTLKLEMFKKFKGKHTFKMLKAVQKVDSILVAPKKLKRQIANIKKTTPKPKPKPNTFFKMPSIRLKPFTKVKLRRPVFKVARLPTKAPPPPPPPITIATTTTSQPPPAFSFQPVTPFDFDFRQQRDLRNEDLQFRASFKDEIYLDNLVGVWVPGLIPKELTWQGVTAN